MSGGLSRDILRWMQSLDLSYSVKNPKRDFSNGFVIAEIFSKYYRKDVEMHSYDSGSSLPKREANWQLLNKFFKRVGFNIKPSQIQAIIHHQSGAAVPVVEQVYTFLTNKKVVAINLSHTKQSGEATIVPPFARPTASTKVKQRLREPDVVKAQDVSQIQSRAVEAIEIHEDDLRYERVAEPERFQRTQTIARVPTRKVGQAENAQPVVEFKSVQVKQLDAANFARLRANRRNKGGSSSPAQKQASSSDAGSNRDEVSVASSVPNNQQQQEHNGSSALEMATHAVNGLLRAKEEKIDEQAENELWDMLRNAASERVNRQEAHQWSDLFLAVSDHLVVELPYAEHSSDALQILDSFAFDPATASAALSVFEETEVDGEPRIAALAGVFMMMAEQTPESDEFRHLCDFITSVLQQGGLHESAALQLLNSVPEQHLQVPAAASLYEEAQRVTSADND